MPLLSLLGKKEKVSLLIDIGNGAISAGLILFRDNLKPKHIYSIKMPFLIEENIKNDVLLQSMNTLLDQVLIMISKNGFTQAYLKNKKAYISSVLVSFSSPWFVSRSKNIHLDQDVPFVITKSFIENILETEKNLYEKELAKSEYEKVFEGEIKIIENIVVHTMVNGYPILNSIGKRTKIFDASIYTSYVSKSVLDIVYNQIFKHTHIHNENLFVSTFPLISFTITRDLFPSADSFLFMDIGAEVTDITFVSNNSIVDIASYQSGRNFIIRQIAKKFKVSTEIAESLLHMYNTKSSDEETTLIIQSVLLDSEKEWSIYFDDACTELSKKSVLPSNIFVMAENDVTQIYNDYLKNTKTDNTTTSKKTLNIVNINNEMLSTVYDNDKRFPQDESIGILVAFFNKITTK